MMTKYLSEPDESNLQILWEWIFNYKCLIMCMYCASVHTYFQCLHHKPCIKDWYWYILTQNHITASAGQEQHSSFWSSGTELTFKSATYIQYTLYILYTNVMRARVFIGSMHVWVETGNTIYVWACYDKRIVRCIWGSSSICAELLDSKANTVSFLVSV